MRYIGTAVLFGALLFGQNAMAQNGGNVKPAQVRAKPADIVKTYDFKPRLFRVEDVIKQMPSYHDERTRMSFANTNPKHYSELEEFIGDTPLGNAYAASRNNRPFRFYWADINLYSRRLAGPNPNEQPTIRRQLSLNRRPINKTIRAGIALLFGK